MPNRLGDCPAAVIFQLRQQAAHHLAAALPGLPPGKAPGHLPQQIRQQRGQAITRYRGGSDGFVCSNHRQSLTARPGRSEEKLILTLA